MNNVIEPFQWICLKNGGASVDLDVGAYRKEFFLKYAGEFETECGNGYDWELFAERYLKKCFPDMTKSIQFDPESEMFCIYSKHTGILDKFARELKRVTEDLRTMETVWQEVRKHYRVYAAMEYTPLNEPVLSYVGVTTLPLEERLKQHQMSGKNFIKLFLIDAFADRDEARAYEEVIEEIMTNPALNKGHLFQNENNSLHPYGDNALYENATTWAVVNMRNKGYMSQEGKLDVLDTFYREAEVLDFSGRPDLGRKDSHFNIMQLENGMLSVSLDTSSYKKEVFARRMNEGIMGSGYDWEKAASVLRQDLGPDWFCDVYFDSEADLFCAYSDNAEKFMEFVSKLKELCEDDARFGEVIGRI